MVKKLLKKLKKCESNVFRDCSSKIVVHFHQIERIERKKNEMQQKYIFLEKCKNVYNWFKKCQNT